MKQKYSFRPNLQYWLTQWLPIFIVIITLCTTGIRRNLYTPTSDRAIGASVVMICILVVTFIRFARRKIVLSEKSLTIYTPLHSYFWTKEQIEAINFELGEENNEPHLYVSISHEGFHFNINAFDSDAIEEAFENWIGLEYIGIDAVQTSGRYKRERELEESALQREGESKEYFGGPLGRTFIFHIVLVTTILGGLGILLFHLDLWPLGTLLLIFTAIWSVRWIAFYGSVYMNRDHIVFLSWGKQEMIWWRDVHKVELSEYIMIFTGQDQCLAIPGPFFWASTDQEKMITLFTRQMTERYIFASSDFRWYRPRNRNVRTDRQFPFSRKKII